MARPFINAGIHYVGTFEIKSGNTRRMQNAEILNLSHMIYHEGVCLSFRFA